MKGVLFDFNGMLFFDYELHKESWRETLMEVTEGKLDFDTFFLDNYGKKNEEMIQNACKCVGKPMQEEEIVYYSKEKEKKYRVKAKEKGCVLAPGAERLLDQLKEKGISCNIATASIEENVQFYIKEFHLSKWFDPNKIIFDNGKFKDKEEMYRTAADVIGVSVEESVIFEDSPGGIKAALDTGCKNVVIVNSSQSSFSSHPNIKMIIEDFESFRLHDWIEK